MTADDRRVAFIAEAQRLRRAYDAARSEFFEHLLLGEEDREMWASSGFAYGQFLEHEGIAKESEYNTWKRGRGNIERATNQILALEEATQVLGATGNVPPETMTKVLGAEFVKAVASVRTEDEIVEACRRGFQSIGSNKSPPSPSTSKHIVRQVRTFSAGQRNRTRSMADMEAEIDRWRQKYEAAEETNKALRAELKGLRTENKRLKRELRKHGGGDEASQPA